MTARKPKPPTTLEVETDKRFITVKDQDLSDALQAFATALSATRSPEQVSRQLKKLVQFGLYDSEKSVQLKSEDETAPKPVAEPAESEPQPEPVAETETETEPAKPPAKKAKLELVQAAV